MLFQDSGAPRAFQAAVALSLRPYLQNSTKTSTDIKYHDVYIRWSRILKEVRGMKVEVAMGLSRGVSESIEDEHTYAYTLLRELMPC